MPNKAKRKENKIGFTFRWDIPLGTNQTEYNTYLVVQLTIQTNLAIIVIKHIKILTRLTNKGRGFNGENRTSSVSCYW